MEDKNKQVVFDSIKPTKSLLRYVERQVEKWLEKERNLLLLPRESDYFIKVEHEKTQPCFHCFIKVHIGNYEWQSYETGKSIQDVLSHAIHHLRITNGFEPMHTLERTTLPC